ncbi:glycosyltransferase family 4 protein [Vibrio sp. 99-70-13A1]|uniref:glycosyltransferase family 4 protein n=1 Tax=Vibrio sp. 99-70-13A1 TaxID=2607601 RepID=UPI0014935C3C|nr:glycosyltransferase family 4 protein [Vibrio sp. 99-70-13A1]NOH98656.1 glycosyltransferase family 4 protein [Vibrio sp. 99-70-13A1]
MKNTKRILYVHYGDNWIRGSEVCLINLIDSLNKERYTPFLWTNCPALLHHYEGHNITSELSAFPLIGGWQSPRFDTVSWCHLVKHAIHYIKTYGIDVIHVNSGAPCQWMCLAARICQVPLVTQLHSHYQLRDRFTLGLHMSPHIVCVSDAISKELLSDGYPKNKLSVIPNGVSMNFKRYVNVRQTLHIPDNAFVFATVGSLIIRKGVDLIIQALKHISPAGNIHLVVIGEGEERKNLETLVSKLGLSDNVHFVGEQSNVSNWLVGGVDAFVSGAREEAFGLVLAEAGLAKLPVVAPQVGGIPEFIKHEITGLLYSPKNPIIDMASCMLALISNVSLRSRLAENLYQLASTRLTIESNTHALESLYARITHEPSSHCVPIAHGLKPLLRWTFR